MIGRSCKSIQNCFTIVQHPGIPDDEEHCLDVPVMVVTTPSFTGPTSKPRQISAIQLARVSERGRQSRSFDRTSDNTEFTWSRGIQPSPTWHVAAYAILCHIPHPRPGRAKKTRNRIWHHNTTTLYHTAGKETAPCHSPAGHFVRRNSCQTPSAAP